jgi:hypothetical protein
LHGFLLWWFFFSDMYLWRGISISQHNQRFAGLPVRKQIFEKHIFLIIVAPPEFLLAILDQHV